MIFWNTNRDLGDWGDRRLEWVMVNAQDNHPIDESGVVTRGHKVAIRAIADPIRPIHSGILTPCGDSFSPAAREFVGFIRKTGAKDRG